jgi:anti-sigma factor RsiW
MNKEDKHPEKLLPWYVNDTLTDDERRGVEAHLKDCERCRSEVAYLNTLRSQVKATSDVTSYGELGLKRLTALGSPRVRTAMFIPRIGR